jgi:hypothetical protein
VTSTTVERLSPNPDCTPTTTTPPFFFLVLRIARLEAIILENEMKNSGPSARIRLEFVCLFVCLFVCGALYLVLITDQLNQETLGSSAGIVAAPSAKPLAEVSVGQGGKNSDICASIKFLVGAFFFFLKRPMKQA